jgi:hypothetical protein
MNILFALFGYRVFTVDPVSPEAVIGGQETFVLLTPRVRLPSGQQIRAYRISNTVFFEPKGDI